MLQPTTNVLRTAANRLFDIPVESQKPPQTQTGTWFDGSSPLIFPQDSTSLCVFALLPLATDCFATPQLRIPVYGVYQLSANDPAVIARDAAALLKTCRSNNGPVYPLLRRPQSDPNAFTPAAASPAQQKNGAAPPPPPSSQPPILAQPNGVIGGGGGGAGRIDVVAPLALPVTTFVDPPFPQTENRIHFTKVLPLDSGGGGTGPAVTGIKGGGASGGVAEPSSGSSHTSSSFGLGSPQSPPLTTLTHEKDKDVTSTTKLSLTPPNTVVSVAPQRQPSPPAPTAVPDIRKTPSHEQNRASPNGNAAAMNTNPPSVVVPPPQPSLALPPPPPPTGQLPAPPTVPMTAAMMDGNAVMTLIREEGKEWRAAIATLAAGQQQFTRIIEQQNAIMKLLLQHSFPAQPPPPPPSLEVKHTPPTVSTALLTAAAPSVPVSDVKVMNGDVGGGGYPIVPSTVAAGLLASSLDFSTTASGGVRSLNVHIPSAQQHTTQHPSFRTPSPPSVSGIATIVTGVVGGWIAFIFRRTAPTRRV